MLFVLLGTGCASQETSPSLEQSAVFPSYQGSYASAPIPAEWIPLYQRLRADGLDGPDLPRYFSMMGTPSQDPMGRKIKELYTKAFAPKPKPTPSAKPSKPRPKVYPGVITAENVEKCRAFLAENAAAFDFAERTYGVPREIAVSLLFVETRLGTFLGKEKAFYTLASMASSRQPDDISSYLDRLPGASGRLGWIQERMEQRSDWAYKEFVALLGNVRA